MEDLWKRFKEETRGHIQKINEFLNEESAKEKTLTPTEPLTVLNSETQKEINQQIIDETSKQIEQAVWIEKSSENSSRKEIYGNLKDLVKEIMEKEHVSRAQAYRKARKRFLERTQ